MVLVMFVLYPSMFVPFAFRVVNVLYLRSLCIIIKFNLKLIKAQTNLVGRFSKLARVPYPVLYISVSYTH